MFEQEVENGDEDDDITYMGQDETVHCKFKSRLLGTRRKVSLDRMPVNNLEYSSLIYGFSVLLPFL